MGLTDTMSCQHGSQAVGGYVKISSNYSRKKAENIMFSFILYPNLHVYECAVTPMLGHSSAITYTRLTISRDNIPLKYTVCMPV